MATLRPGKMAGIALLCIAAVALVLGVATALDKGGSSSSTTAAISSSESSPAATSQAPSSTASSTPATSSTPSSAAATSSVNPSTVVVAPPSDNGTTSTPTAGTTGGSTGTTYSDVRVYNNSSNIKGLATKAATDFRSAGFTVTEVGNYSSGNIPTSTAYYTAGNAQEQATAQALATKFGMKTDVRFEGIASSSPGVIVIITNDFKG